MLPLASVGAGDPPESLGNVVGGGGGFLLLGESRR
uniref:Uncharacterized protein n=1 Tax=Arundo donax TaxID=35708 RepID=A0A0A8ZSN9_ARUDO